MTVESKEHSAQLSTQKVICKDGILLILKNYLLYNFIHILSIYLTDFIHFLYCKKHKKIL